MSQLAQALVALDGHVGLVAQDGVFLGVMSSDINHPNSIINPNTYGNPHGNTIYNQHSLYGGERGLYSPLLSLSLKHKLKPLLHSLFSKMLTGELSIAK